MGNKQSQQDKQAAAKDVAVSEKDNKKADANKQTSATNNKRKTPDIDLDSLPEYTVEEVARHDSKENGVWLILDGLVYDPTSFLPKHPGGAGFLLEVAGEDATSEFEAAIHSQDARDKAKEFLIGKLKPDASKQQGLSLSHALGQQQPQQNVCFLADESLRNTHSASASETRLQVPSTVQGQQVGCTVEADQVPEQAGDAANRQAERGRGGAVRLADGHVQVAGREPVRCAESEAQW